MSRLSRLSRFFIGKRADYSRQRLPRAGEFHLDGGDGAALQSGDLGDGVILDVEELEECALRWGKLSERAAKQDETAIAIDLGFECGHVGDESLVDAVDVFGGS